MIVSPDITLPPDGSYAKHDAGKDEELKDMMHTLYPIEKCVAFHAPRQEGLMMSDWLLRSSLFSFRKVSSRGALRPYCNEADFDTLSHHWRYFERSLRHTNK